MAGPNRSPLSRGAKSFRRWKGLRATRSHRTDAEGPGSPLGRAVGNPPLSRGGGGRPRAILEPPPDSEGRVGPDGASQPTPAGSCPDSGSVGDHLSRAAFILR